MKTKKRIFLFAFGVLFFVGAHTVNAQVTIGSELEPASGALLDLKENADGSADKGFKLPKVRLVSLTDLAPCVSSASDADKTYYKGLQVYNTNTSFGEGVFTWNGSRWTQSGLNENLVYNIGWDLTDVLTDIETEITSFTLAPGLYMWNFCMSFRYTVVSLADKNISMYLRNKDTGALLAELHNYAYTDAWIVLNGTSVFNINFETSIAISVMVNYAGKLTAVPISQVDFHFCQFVKLN